MRFDLESLKQEYPLMRKVVDRLSFRTIVQVSVALMLIVAAWNFNHFVESVRYNTGAAARPPVAEGFLPIAAIIAFKVLMATGQIDSIHPAGLVIFVATVITAWLFRRALCSWICPIGALSEQLANVGKRIFGKNINVPRWLDIVLLSVKYILVLFIIRTFLFFPISDAISFMGAPFYAVSDIKMFDFFVNLSATGFIVIGILILLSIPIKSFWCRYVCPYGALLGIIGVLSPVVLVRDSEACTGCGSCNKVCPTRVNVMRKKRIVASSECIGCTMCVSACSKKEALQFKLFGVLPLTPALFSIAFIVLFFGIIEIARITGHWETILTTGDYQKLDSLMSNGLGGF